MAESVFIAGLFILAAGEMVEICKRRDDGAAAEGYALASRQVEKVVWDAGWDGEWFRRAYDDFGDPVGSRQCTEGQIFIEPQGICVMAGLGINDGRARQAMDSVAEQTGDATRYHAAPARIHTLLPQPGGDIFLSARI